MAKTQRATTMGYTKRLRVLLTLLAACPDQLPDNQTFAELFAGNGAWSGGMRLLGYSGSTWDARRSDDHNFLTPVGFMLAIMGAFAIHQCGVLLAAPPCSSWIFATRWTSGRVGDVLGHTESAYIQGQNALVARLVYVLTLCCKRGVWWIVEQPASSIMWEHPRWKRLVRRYRAIVRSVKLDMGAYSMLCVKDTLLVGTAPYLEQMARRMTPDDRQALQFNGHRLVTGKTTVDKSGKRRFQGSRELKQTQAYDFGFGSAHALRYKEFVETHAADNPHPMVDSDSSDSEIGGDDEYLRDLFHEGHKWHDNVKSEHVLRIGS